MTIWIYHHGKENYKFINGRSRKHPWLVETHLQIIKHFINKIFIHHYQFMFHNYNQKYHISQYCRFTKELRLVVHKWWHRTITINVQITNHLLFCTVYTLVVSRNAQICEFLNFHYKTDVRGWSMITNRKIEEG